jgi:arylsulfatase A-like enzyme/formylglycine-generating enzyme required for sulfatase activity
MLRILTFVILIFISLSCQNKPQNLEKPNVLMISVDDMNNWVSFLRNFNSVRTPNLDRLARKACVFKNAHAPATLCNPSRTAILTGKLPSSTGVYSNNQPANEFITQSQTKTIFHHFKEHGYYLLGVGKIFHVKNDIPIFDEFYRPKRDLTNIGSATPWNICDANNDTNIDKQVAQWAINQFDKEFDKPFFMSVGFFLPHHPWIMPKKYFDYYPLEKIKIPKTLVSDYDDIPIIARTRIIKFLKLNSQLKYQNQIKQNIQAYLAAITYMDEQLGRVLDALEASPYGKNTIIVFWSDHGYHLGEKHTLRKSTLWDPSTNVPLLISIPDKKARIKTAVSLIDIFPTLIELCHLPKLAGLEGSSLVDLINHKSHRRTKPVLTIQDPGNYAIRDDHWKYISYSDGSEEFYDVAQDPLEFKNLADSPRYKKQKNKLKKFLPKNQKQKFNGKKDEMVWINHLDNKTMKFYSFWIDRHEVTNSDFEKYVTESKYKTSAEKLTEPHPGSLVFCTPAKKLNDSNNENWWKFIKNAVWNDPQGDGRGIKTRKNHPVVQVSYYDAFQFCKYYGKRLPTEEEWEIAYGNSKKMQLQETTKNWNLNIFQGEFPYKDLAEDGYAGTAPVMSYKANLNGIFDLGGNVWEWVASPGYKANSHKIKGGSFLCGNHCQGFNPLVSLEMQDDESTDHIGFRCVD